MDRRALVVDDEPAICALLRDILESRGWLVETAHDAAAALALAGPFALGVIDLTLPGRPTGGELCDRLLGRGLRVVTMTGNIDWLQQHGPVRPAHGLLVKPFRMAEVFAAIEAALKA